MKAGSSSHGNTVLVVWARFNIKDCQQICAIYSSPSFSPILRADKQMVLKFAKQFGSSSDHWKYLVIWMQSAQTNQTQKILGQKLLQCSHNTVMGSVNPNPYILQCIQIKICSHSLSSPLIPSFMSEKQKTQIHHLRIYVSENHKFLADRLQQQGSTDIWLSQHNWAEKSSFHPFGFQETEGAAAAPSPCLLFPVSHQSWQYWWED